MQHADPSGASADAPANEARCAFSSATLESSESAIALADGSDYAAHISSLFPVRGDFASLITKLDDLFLLGDLRVATESMLCVRDVTLLSLTDGVLHEHGFWNETTSSGSQRWCVNTRRTLSKLLHFNPSTRVLTMNPNSAATYREGRTTSEGHDNAQPEIGGQRGPSARTRRLCSKSDVRVEPLDEGQTDPAGGPVSAIAAGVTAGSDSIPLTAGSKDGPRIAAAQCIQSTLQLGPSELCVLPKELIPWAFVVCLQNCLPVDFKFSETKDLRDAKTYRGYVSLIVQDLRFVFQSCFFVGKKDLAVRTPVVEQMLLCVKAFLNAPRAKISPAPSGEMTVCPQNANTWETCASAAKWIALHSDIPCSVPTNAAAAPLFLIHTAVQLGITFTCRTQHFVERRSDNVTELVLTYRCLRSGTHRDVGELSHLPELVISARLGEDIVEKGKRRRSPLCSCDCPFLLRLRVDLPKAMRHTADSSSTTLESLRVSVEFPFSPGWHGDTHFPDRAEPVCVDGVSVPRAPRVDGEADDSYFDPLHPFIQRLLYSLAKSDVTAQQASRIAQAYMTWLRPLFVRYPDILTSWIPCQILMLSSGRAPTFCMRNHEEFYLDSCDPYVLDDDHKIAKACEVVSSTAQVPMNSSDDQPVEASGTSSVITTPALTDANHGSALDLLAVAATESPTLNSDAPLALQGRDFRRLSLPDNLRRLGQEYAYSCCSWLLNDRAVGSMFQWVKEKSRNGQTVIDNCRLHVVPSLVQHGWAFGPRVVQLNTSGGRELQMVVSTPLAKLTCERFARFGGTVSVDALYGTTIFEQPVLPFVIEDYYTLKSLLLGFGVGLQIDLDASDSGSGFNSVSLTDSRDARFCNRFKLSIGDDVDAVAVPRKALLANVFAQISTALGLQELPVMHETRPISRNSYIVQQQLSLASDAGLNPAYLQIDDEAALWRAARLHVHYSHAKSYALQLRSYHERIVAILVTVFRDYQVSDADIVNADKLLSKHSSTSVLNNSQTDEFVANLAIQTLLTELFTVAFIEFISNHATSSGKSLAYVTLLLLSFDLHRIRECVEHNDKTIPLGHFREFMDDVIQRWQAVALPSGPLGQYLRFTAILSVVLCHYHSRASWSRYLMGLRTGIAVNGSAASTATEPTLSPEEKEWMLESGTTDAELQHFSDASCTAPAADSDYFADFDYLQAISEMVDLNSDPDDIRACILHAVMIEAVHVRQSTTVNDFEARCARFLAKLGKVWPLARLYFIRHVFNRSVRSFLVVAWRRFFLSSNATAGPESVNNLIRYLIFHGTRSRDPSAPFLRIGGFPGDESLTERSLTNLLYNRNIIHVQQRGSTDAGLRQLRVIQKAALILAEATLKINGTSIQKRTDLPFVQVLDIHYTGTFRIFESRMESERKKNMTPSSVSTSCVSADSQIAADELGEDVDGVPAEICECKSASVQRLVKARADSEAASFLRRVRRTRFVVNLSTRTCTCERHSTRCPELLAGEIYARNVLKWQPCVYDEDDRIVGHVQSLADKIVAHVRAKGSVLAVYSPLKSSFLSVAKKNRPQNSPPPPGSILQPAGAQAMKALLDRLAQLQSAVSQGLSLRSADVGRVQQITDLIGGLLQDRMLPVTATQSLVPEGLRNLHTLVTRRKVAVSATAPTRNKVNAVARRKFATTSVGKTVTSPVYSMTQLWTALSRGTRTRRRGKGVVSIGKKRPKKPSCLYELRGLTQDVAPGRVIAIDFETAGLSTASRRIVQIGAIDCAGLTSFDELVNPGLGISIHPQATQLHNISDGDVALSPPFATVWLEFLTCFGLELNDSASSSSSHAGPVILLSYNGFSFDFPVLLNELARSGLRPPPNVLYADLLVHVRKGCFGKSLGGNALSVVFKNVFGTVMADAHSGIGDAKGIKALYRKAAGLDLAEHAHASLGSSDALTLELHEACVRIPAKRQTTTDKSTSSIGPESGKKRGASECVSNAIIFRAPIKKKRVIPPVPAPLPAIPAVLALFGVEHSKFAALTESFLYNTARAGETFDSLSHTARRTAAGHAPAVDHRPVSKYVPNHTLSSLRGWVDTTGLSFFFRLVELSCSGAVTCLDALHVVSMPGGPSFGDGSLCIAMGADLGLRHLRTPVACSWTHDGHHGFLYKDYPNNNIFVLDPQGNPHLYERHAKALQRWMATELSKAGEAAREYNIIYVDNIAHQADGISCGVFVCLYLYFKVFHKRWPTTNDIAPQQAILFRIVLFEIFMRGRLRMPDSSTARLDKDGFCIIDDSTIIGSPQSNAVVNAHQAVSCPRKLAPLTADMVKTALAAMSCK